MKVFYIKQLTRRGRRTRVLSADSFCHVVCRVFEKYPGTSVLQVEDLTTTTSPVDLTTDTDIVESPILSYALTVFFGMAMAGFFAHHALVISVSLWSHVALSALGLYGALMAIFNLVRLAKGIRFEQWASQPYLPDQVSLVSGHNSAAIERDGDNYRVVVRGTVELGRIKKFDGGWELNWVTGSPMKFRSFDQALFGACKQLCEHV